MRSLTGHPDRSTPFGNRARMYPFNFDDPDELATSLEGADTLFNTYWIRVNYKDTTHLRRGGILLHTTVFDSLPDRARLQGATRNSFME